MHRTTPLHNLSLRSKGVLAPMAMPKPHGSWGGGARPAQVLVRRAAGPSEQSQETRRDPSFPVWGRLIFLGCARTPSPQESPCTRHCSLTARDKARTRGPGVTVPPLSVEPEGPHTLLGAALRQRVAAPDTRLGGLSGPQGWVTAGWHSGTLSLAHSALHCSAQQDLTWVPPGSSRMKMVWPKACHCLSLTTPGSQTSHKMTTAQHGSDRIRRL